MKKAFRRVFFSFSFLTFFFAFPVLFCFFEGMIVCLSCHCRSLIFATSPSLPSRYVFVLCVCSIRIVLYNGRAGSRGPLPACIVMEGNPFGFALEASIGFYTGALGWRLIACGVFVSVI